MAAVLALGLSLAYTAVIARALGFAEPVTCSCFGRFGAARVSRLTLARNLVLSLVTALAVWGAASGQHVWGLVTEDAAWLVVAALVVALFSLVAAGSGNQVTVSTVAAVAEESLDYVRLPIPYAQLRTGAADELTTLRDLARVQARLLVFLSAGCGSCRRTAERLDDWSEQLEPAVGIVPIYSYDPGEVPYRLPWYLQPEQDTSRVLGVSGTPVAVLLGADDLLAGGPISGEDSVRRFVEDILSELHKAAPAATQPAMVSGEAG